MTKRKIYICDSTMHCTDDRAGDAGASLSFREKIELAKLLDRLRVSVIETSVIEDVGTDSLLVKSLASAVKFSILAVPMNINDPDAAQICWNAVKDAAHPRLQLAVPVSTVQMEYLCHRKPAALLELVGNLISQAKSLCPDVEFVANDFTRCDAAFLFQAIDAALSAGASVITVADAAGDLFYDEFFNRVKAVREHLPEGVRLGVRCSNELFLADSCVQAALVAGADEIKTVPFGHCTVSLCHLVKMLQVKADTLNVAYDLMDTELGRAVSLIKRLCEPNRSKPSPYSNVVTAQNGPDFSLGINDSKADVIAAVKKLDYDLTPEDEDNVYDAFVRIATRNPRVEAKELEAIVSSVAFHVPPTYVLDSYVINSGNKITATSHIRIRKDRETMESVCLGDGPIDASFLAMEKLLGRHFELDDFQIRSVTEGREAVGETIVRLRYNGKIYSGRGISTDIVGSSIMAYLNAVNKIVYEEKEN